ncbi:MAG: adenosylmethionine--8-amino-7-oxononanoate transaminase [Thermoproteota archaeon]|nr:adenosylmethionine--8-amino-7-oxononanoate transaminase [Thermoproteota archaeon]
MDKEFVWHPYTQMTDWKKWNNRVIVKGDGFYLLDSEGRRYLDGTASMWCNVWGHGHNKVTNAMIEQLKNIQHSTLFGIASGPSAKLAERLISLARGMKKVFYSDNGSTAIEVAMKIARQYWYYKGKDTKREFISIEHGYHGDTFGAMSAGYIDRFFKPYKPLLFNVHKVPSPLLYGSGFGHESDLVEWCLDKTEAILKKNEHRCAALIMESGAQIAGGSIIYPRGYQRKVARLCRDHDTLLILDEIATAFGRLGNMIEYIAQGSQPDLVCFGKALTGGYFPLAVTLATERVFNAFTGKYSYDKQLYHGHTFTGHPVGCAAAFANIQLYEDRNLIRQIRINTEYIAKRLSELSESPIVADIRHKGMLAGIELARNNKPLVALKNKRRTNYLIMQESLKLGVHLRPLGNIMMVIPPLAIGKSDLKNLLDVQLKILRKIETLS